MLKLDTITADERAWPLIYVRLEGALTTADFEQYLAFMDAQLALGLTRRQRVGVLLDARGVQRADAPIRKLQADWMRANFEALELNTAGLAFVIESALVRGILQAILWLQRLPSEYCLVGEVEQAEDWLREQLARCGPPPQSVDMG